MKVGIKSAKYLFLSCFAFVSPMQTYTDEPSGNHSPRFAQDSHLTSKVIGSIGDGPITDAIVDVYDKNFNLVWTEGAFSDASYALELKLKGRSYPLYITAKQGIDLVTNREQDFILASAVLRKGRNASANMNPHSTLIVNTALKMPGGLKSENIDLARNATESELNFGWGSFTSADPMTLSINESNVAAVVKSSETLGEAIRRTRNALLQSGESSTGDAVLDSISADLADGLLNGSGAPGASKKTTALFKLVSAQVLLETLSNNLKVDGVVAKSLMDQAIQDTNPSFDPSISTQHISISQRIIDQTKLTVRSALAISQDQEIIQAASLLDNLTAGSSPETVGSLLPPQISESLSNEINELAASTDESLFLAVLTGESNNNPNLPPTISGAPTLQIEEGGNYSFTPTAADPENDALSYSVSNKPNWASFSTVNGSLNGSPDFDSAGSYDNIAISVSDGVTSAQLSPFSILVQNTNRSPEASALEIVAQAGIVSTGALPAIDPDGDPIVYSILTTPALGDSIVSDAGSGLFTYETAVMQAASDEFTYQATDNSGATSTASVVVTIQETPVDDVPDDEEPPPNGDSPTGLVTASLHPGLTVQPGATISVAFGLPLPPELVSDVSKIVVTDASGLEISSDIVETARWRSLGSTSVRDSLRAALVYVDVTFDSLEPIELNIVYNDVRTMELGSSMPAVQDTWVPIHLNENPNEYSAVEGIMEPEVYVTFPADWLSETISRTITTPINSSPEWQWFDDAYVNFSKTAVNDVSEFVDLSNYINYETGYEPWLLDRAMTLFGVYTRTGDVKWLRHAHRAAQFYSKHLRASGTFDLVRFDDLKYSYGQSLFTELLFMGDISMLPLIESVANAGYTWNETYVYSAGSYRLWTERHQTYALLAALSAWEATGSSEHASRVIEVANATFNLASNPQNGWAVDGCALHSYEAHEGSTPTGDPGLQTCSTWMSALLADAVLRYFLHSEDLAALEFLANLGDYITNHGSYVSDTSPFSGMLMPYYLASSAYQLKSNDGASDYKHACDVAGLTAKAAWARSQLNGDPASLLNTTYGLLESCAYDLDYMHRPGSDVSHGYTQWRLAPPRQYNWWFGTTLDLQSFVELAEQ